LVFSFIFPCFVSFHIFLSSFAFLFMFPSVYFQLFAHSLALLVQEYEKFDPKKQQEASRALSRLRLMVSGSMALPRMFLYHSLFCSLCSNGNESW
jgi:hypothetical protein